MRSTARRGIVRPVLWLTGCAAWLVAVVVGFGLVCRYDQTPGPVADAPSAWPTPSRLRSTPGRHCLVLALHPHCPCSRATVTELEEILARCGDRLVVHVLFLIPAGCDEAWARTELWDRVAALRNVAVHGDEEGTEARRFGAATSGHAVLYGPGGECLFRGGITRGRGQEGANVGRAAILAHVLGTATGAAQAEVFGCPLGLKPCDATSGENACPDVK